VRSARILRFGVVGVVNTAVYYACYLALSTVLPYLAAHVIAFVTAMIGSFFLNCHYTFRIKPTWRKFLLFPLSNITNFVVTSVGLYVLVGRLHMNSTIAPLVAAAVAIPVTFVVAHYILVDRHPAGETPVVLPESVV